MDSVKQKILNSVGFLVIFYMSSPSQSADNNCFELEKKRGAENIRYQLCLDMKISERANGVTPVSVVLNGRDNVAFSFRSTGFLVDPIPNDGGGDGSIYIVLDPVTRESEFYSIKKTLYEGVSPIHFKGRIHFKSLDTGGVVTLGQETFTYRQSSVPNSSSPNEGLLSH